MTSCGPVYLAILFGDVAAAPAHPQAGAQVFVSALQPSDVCVHVVLPQTHG